MERVQGIGGIFIRAKNREALAHWYRDHLGIDVDDNWFGAVFEWSKQHNAATANTHWSVFSGNSDYFGDKDQTYMINFRVANLDAMLNQLRSLNANVADKIEESEFGRFGWVTDPEGNRIELWEPPHSS